MTTEADKLRLVQQTLETQLSAVAKRYGRDALRQIPSIKELGTIVNIHTWPREKPYEY